MRFLPFLPCALLIPSCVLGPEPKNAEIALPAGIRGDAAPHGESFGNKSWRAVFTDPTLRSLIERALRDNPDLVAATFRIEEARAQAGSARAAWFPAVNASAAASETYLSRNTGQGAPGGSRSSQSYDLTAPLSWEIDLWGGIRRSNQAARARLLATQHDRDAVQTSLISAVAAAYIDLQNLDERLAISRSTSASRKNSLDLVTTRRDGGVSSDLEVGQADALLGEADISIPVTEQAIAAKENELRALIGSFPGSVARSGSLDRLDRNLRISAGLPSSLLERRPDLAAANQAFQAATADIGTAEALRLPTFSLTGRAGMASSDLNNLLQGKSATFSIGPQLVGPLFDAGRSGFAVKAAQARARQAHSDYRKAALQAFREAADSLNAFQKTGEIIDRRARQIAALKRVASVALERFKGGSSGYLEVLDAERSLFDAELQLADAKRDRLQAVVQAYRALGGGWK
jgi:multidrug efflux system outer membrane protein